MVKSTHTFEFRFSDTLKEIMSWSSCIIHWMPLYYSQCRRLTFFCCSKIRYFYAYKIKDTSLCLFCSQQFNFSCVRIHSTV